MPLSDILAQDTAISTLERALRGGRVHHAYRFEGPDGVGKERAAFALAQALVCTGGDPLGCGQCSACKRAVTLSSERPHTSQHPDVALIERNLYPAESIGRSRPELTEISVDQVRRIVLSHAGYPPHEGRARVYIIRRADELSISAANALLKTLEEPRSGTHFVLLTSRGDRLLTTIRSRTLPLRFAPLPDAVIHGILTAKGISADRQALAVELAGGSASAAIDLCDPELTAARDGFVATVLEAVRAKDLGPALALAEAKDRDKMELRSDLRAVGAALARMARAEISASTEEPEGAGREPRLVEPTAVLAKRYEAVARAVTSLERNASPSLTMVAMITEMREAAS
jgi:DNA polymerase-3 subunit delta'